MSTCKPYQLANYSYISERFTWDDTTPGLFHTSTTRHGSLGISVWCSQSRNSYCQISFLEICSILYIVSICHLCSSFLNLPSMLSYLNCTFEIIATLVGLLYSLEWLSWCSHFTFLVMSVHSQTFTTGFTLPTWKSKTVLLVLATACSSTIHPWVSRIKTCFSSLWSLQLYLIVSLRVNNNIILSVMFTFTVAQSTN